MATIRGGYIGLDDDRGPGGSLIGSGMWTLDKTLHPNWTPFPVVYIASAFAEGGGSSTLNVTIPGGAQAGDVVIGLGWSINQSLSSVTGQPSGTALNLMDTDIAEGRIVSGDTTIRFTTVSASNMRYGVFIYRNGETIMGNVSGGGDTIPGETYSAAGGEQVALLYDAAGGAISAPSGWTTIANTIYSGDTYHFIRRSVSGVVGDVIVTVETDKTVSAGVDSGRQLVPG